MQKFNDFYQSLDFLNLVLFWGIILVIILIILFLIIAIFKTRKDKYVPEYEEENVILDTYDTKDEVPIQVNTNKIVFDEGNSMQGKIIIDDEIHEKEKVKNESLFDGFVETPKKEKSNLYQKNVFREMSSRYQTSPIGIVREEKKEIDDYEESINSDNQKYLVNVYNDLENAIVPDKIELTDYEKKQEEDAVISYQELIRKKNNIDIDENEDAVISYQELLDRKEKLYNIREEEENQEFISELKKFRNDL